MQLAHAMASSLCSRSKSVRVDLENLGFSNLPEKTLSDILTDSQANSDAGVHVVEAAVQYVPDFVIEEEAEPERIDTVNRKNVMISSNGVEAIDPSIRLDQKDRMPPMSLSKPKAGGIRLSRVNEEETIFDPFFNPERIRAQVAEFHESEIPEMDRGFSFWLDECRRRSELISTFPRYRVKCLTQFERKLLITDLKSELRVFKNVEETFH